MNSAGHLVWLASYPKSGNTWVRALLAAYLNTTFDLGHMDVGGHYAMRGSFDAALGVPTSILRQVELDGFRGEVWRRIARNGSEHQFVKVHDMWRRGSRDEEIFPADVTRFAVEIVRNPLSIVASKAHHDGATLDETIEAMGTQMMPAREQVGVPSQLPQIVGSWSDNVTSWLDQDEIPVLLLRYEDMLTDSAAALRKILEGADIPIDELRVQTATSRASFDMLRAREVADGFAEATRPNNPFFRSGRANSWREELNDEQISRVCSDHETVMRRLGYEIPDA